MKKNTSRDEDENIFKIIFDANETVNQLFLVHSLMRYSEGNEHLINNGIRFRF